MSAILVVEDEPALSGLFSRLLRKKLSLDTRECCNPPQVLRICREEDIALVIMDVSLCGASLDGRAVTGADLSRILKGDPATSHIPIVLVTAHAMTGDEQRLLAESRADMYQSKPIVDIDGFVSRVQQMVAKAA